MALASLAGQELKSRIGTPRQFGPSKLDCYPRRHWPSKRRTWNMMSGFLREYHLGRENLALDGRRTGCSGGAHQINACFPANVQGQEGNLLVAGQTCHLTAPTWRTEQWEWESTWANPRTTGRLGRRCHRRALHWVGGFEGRQSLAAKSKRPSANRPLASPPHIGGSTTYSGPGKPMKGSCEPRIALLCSG